MLFSPYLNLDDNSENKNELKIHIQTKYNRKRLRKKGRKHHRRERNFKEVLYAIFEQYEIIDHIAPSEIDPYWQKLYKYYETIIYLKKYIEKSLKFDDKLYYWDNTEILDIFEFLTYLEQKIFNYLCGYFNLIIRLTLKKRFWGWGYYYNDKFFPELWEVLIRVLKSCAFNVDQSKPSVYFVNTCWFKGIQITKEIYKSLEREKFFYIDGNRGRFVFKEEEYGKKMDFEFDEISNILNEEDISEVDLFEELRDYFTSKKEITDEDLKKEISSELDISESDENFQVDISLENNHYQTQGSSITGYTNKTTEDEIITQEQKSISSSIIEKIINHFNFSDLNDLLKHKKEIKEKIYEINLTDIEKEYLKNLLNE